MDQFVSGSAARNPKKFVLNNCEIRQILIMSSAVFIEESLKFIQSMVRTEKLSQERGHRYMKEILHSIFFHCYIYRHPKEIQGKLPIHSVNVVREDLHSKLSEKFPDVFQSYTSQLPRRSPFSVLLEVVVETTVDRNDSDVLRVLENLNNNMVVPRCRDNIIANVFCLRASVVSFCYFERTGQKTQRYFGASMSCRGRTATRIFISVACIETWNENVAHAVCLAAEGYRSITLPDTVWSTAYRLRTPREGENNSQEYKELSPCSLCLKIFPNVTFSSLHKKDQDKQVWNYGNCAECEAISNLLNGETSVSEEVQQLNTGLAPSLMTLRKRQEDKLRGHLNELKFKVNPEARFYNPE